MTSPTVATIRKQRKMKAGIQFNLSFIIHSETPFQFKIPPTVTARAY